MFTLYSLTSDLHSETPLTASQEAFIKSVEKAVGAPFIHKDSDFSSYDKTENNIIYVRGSLTVYFCDFFDRKACEAFFFVKFIFYICI